MKHTINELSKEQWDLLIARWSDKNIQKLESTNIGSHTNFTWICSKQHEWQARITSMIRSMNSNHRGCPYCRGLKVDSSNCLSTTHPDLAMQWHSSNELSLNDVTAGSNKKAIWECLYGHKWTASILSRSQGNNCPYCSNKILSSSNSLALTHPNLAKQWHPTKNIGITPDKVMAGSATKIWWQCSVASDHEWVTSANKRTSGTNCPCCSGKKIVNSNCLAITHPQLAKEWHIKNKTTPYEVGSGSHKKYWWQCLVSSDHEWTATVANRAKLGTNCPFCDQSKGEIVIASILTKLNIPFETQKKFPTCKDKRQLPFDFYLKFNSTQILLEYQGIQHYEPVGFGGDPNLVYEGIQKRDSIKRKWCDDTNINLLEISYRDFNKIESVLVSFLRNCGLLEKMF